MRDVELSDKSICLDALVEKIFREMCQYLFICDEKVETRPIRKDAMKKILKRAVYRAYEKHIEVDSLEVAVINSLQETINDYFLEKIEKAEKGWGSGHE